MTKRGEYMFTGLQGIGARLLENSPNLGRPEDTVIDYIEAQEEEYE